MSMMRDYGEKQLGVFSQICTFFQIKKSFSTQLHTLVYEIIAVCQYKCNTNLLYIYMWVGWWWVFVCTNQWLIYSSPVASSIVTHQFSCTIHSTLALVSDLFTLSPSRASCIKPNLTPRFLYHSCICLSDTFSILPLYSVMHICRFLTLIIQDLNKYMLFFPLLYLYCLLWFLELP